MINDMVSRREALCSLLLLVVIFFFIGCAPKVYGRWYYPKSGLTIVEVNQEYIADHFLTLKNPTKDDGAPLTIRNVKTIREFYDPESDIIYFQSGYFCTVGHGMCHRSGLPRQVCREYYDFCGFRR